MAKQFISGYHKQTDYRLISIENKEQNKSQENIFHEIEILNFSNGRKYIRKKSARKLRAFS